MKWITGCFGGLVIGLIAGVIASFIPLFLVDKYFIWSFEELVFYVLSLAIITGIIAAIVGFILTVWYQGKKEAKEKQDLEARVPASLIEQPEMGTCIYCGKEIDEETAICDKCLKGQQSNIT